MHNNTDTMYTMKNHDSFSIPCFSSLHYQVHLWMKMCRNVDGGLLTGSETHPEPSLSHHEEPFMHVTHFSEHRTMLYIIQAIVLCYMMQKCKSSCLDLLHSTLLKNTTILLPHATFMVYMRHNNVWKCNNNNATDILQDIISLIESFNLALYLGPTI